MSRPSHTPSTLQECNLPPTSGHPHHTQDIQLCRLIHPKGKTSVCRPPPRRIISGTALMRMCIVSIRWCVYSRIVIVMYHREYNPGSVPPRSSTMNFDPCPNEDIHVSSAPSCLSREISFTYTEAASGSRASRNWVESIPACIETSIQLNRKMCDTVS
jgi:hypothetical protein